MSTPPPPLNTLSSRPRTVKSPSPSGPMSPKDGRELQKTRPRRLLRRHGVSPHHQGFHDPGWVSEYEGGRDRPARNWQSGLEPQGGIQYQAAPAGRPLHGALVPSRLGRQPVFHLPRRSPFPRPPVHRVREVVKGLESSTRSRACRAWAVSEARRSNASRGKRPHRAGRVGAGRAAIHGSPGGSPSGIGLGGRHREPSPLSIGLQQCVAGQNIGA